MTRSLSLTAYLALHRGVEPRDFAAGLPSRPNGPLVWVRGLSPRHGKIAVMLSETLARDGDDPALLVTGCGAGPQLQGQKVIFQPHPEETSAGLRAFLRHWKPDVVVWLQGNLDPVSLVETEKLGIKSLLVDTKGEGLASTISSWVPGMLARLLEKFETILAIDTKSQARLVKLGAVKSQIEVVGALDEALPLLGYSEHERQSFARTLGARPIWLAAECLMNEIACLATAHKQASRRAHRLLLIVNPKVPEDGPAMAQTLRGLGFTVAVRSASEEPEEETQIYVADAPGEMGLWYRIAPITYFGGSLIDGAPRHPFEAAALGSAIVHGPRLGAFDAAFDKLDKAGAARPITTPDDLGAAIEALLSPDKTAQLASAAWTISTDGADASNRLVALIQGAIDARGT